MRSNLTSVKIYELTMIPELQEVQKLDEIVWNEQPIPMHQIITSVQNGGLVLGAYIGKQLVGFSYSFPGFKNGQTYLCSHMLGIHPQYQEIGIGAMLKHVQQHKAREMGYSLITWTFDPLESRNAFLNLTKLHSICSTYVVNCYGDMIDDLNNGLPSDRFKVEWWINSPYVNEQQSIQVKEQVSYFKIKITENNLPKLVDFTLGLEKVLNDDHVKQFLVPVPANFQQIKKSDFNLAVDWRLKTREIFQSLFNNGFVVCSLKRREEQLVHYYVLVKKNMLHLD